MDDSAATPDNVVSLRDEVLRRIGRNVWLFQDIEGQLKWLVQVSFADGPPEELEARQATRAARVSRKTLGALVGDLFEEILTAEAPASLNVDDDCWLRFSFRIEQKLGLSVQLRGDLATVVAERNELVHHARKRWDLTLLESLRKALDELDAQRARILAVRTELTRLVETVRSAAIQLSQYLASEEFRSDFESAHLNSCLIDAVTRAARADGWTPIDRVGQLFRNYVLGLPAGRQAAMPKLSQLLQATGHFELSEVSTSGGSRQMMCRLRPGGDATPLLIAGADPPAH